ncbi:heterokaryon incompatibility protein-domain-containing protein [Daldinia caldariorum]|uniref:heterokaryon incompatibility protein-domain-containing protein n=1 Tax=Daldinia caldariorum TaxID=326644 RepID=UPI002007EC75|nr:heterokaryon incompatibility protein-domain-containing protein [Daldinia caldariorum]KAI1466121.1 heterokaryon incompatibility protein-domain-containing protein [Daldinia caldariorum]
MTDTVCGDLISYDNHILSRHSSADTARSLVCNDCWNGLFARGNFRDIWENLGFFSSSPKARLYTYTSTWNQIEQSSQGGCNWCTLLVSTAKSDKRYNYPHDEDAFFRSFTQTFTVSFKPPSYDGKALVGAQLICVRVGDYELISFPLYTSPDDPCADEVLARDRIYRMKSTETCRLALEHLSHCINDHSACPKPSQVRPLPTRVIDCTDPERPRLYITGGNVNGSYVALSYVWGESQPHKTTQNNLDAYTREIPTDLLPQTSRDAIWATKAFGEKYLWIDALCIIQDSKVDKRQEISKIPAIFSNAAFTIIAARSSKVSDGFLQDCPPPSIPIRPLPFPCKGDPTRFGTMYVEQNSLGGFDDNGDVHDPVNKRAWCLEERLLSTHAFAYTSTTLRFYCPMTRISINDAVRELHDLPTHRLNIEWMPAPEEEHFDPKEETAFDYNRRTTLWDNIIHNYTGRTVTQVEDKLIALAGVASRFSTRWKKGKYMAGLWLDNFQHDLLWHVADGNQLPRLESFRAPSWSWAAVDSQVEATKLQPFDPPLYELDKHVVQLESDILPFGGVTAASLEMRVRLLKAEWRNDGLYAYQPQVTGSNKSENESKIYYAWRDTIEVCHGNVWLLPVAWSTRSLDLWGLVVVPGEKPREYRRVGCFRDFPKWISKSNVLELRLEPITFI